MNISGIRPSEGFYSYNSIKINELRNQQIMSAHQSRLVKEEAVGPSAEEILDAKAAQTFSSMDYAKTYNANDVYELKGNDSDISLLDVKKVVSDLDKDKVLEQYHFFVGSKDASISIVANDNVKENLRSGENFTL